MLCFFPLPNFCVSCSFSLFWPHHAAYGILVPWPGMEPTLPAVKAWSLNHWTTRDVPQLIFLTSCLTTVHCLPYSSRKCTMSFSQLCTFAYDYLPGHPSAWLLYQAVELLLSLQSPFQRWPPLAILLMIPLGRTNHSSLKPVLQIGHCHEWQFIDSLFL